MRAKNQASRSLSALIVVVVAALSAAQPAGAAGSAVQTTVLAPVPAAAVSTTLVSSDSLSGGGAQHATEVEPHITAWGSTLVGSFQIGRYDAGGSAMAMGWARSTDGGATWTSGVLPGLTTAAGGSWPRVVDESVAYDSVHGQWLVGTSGVGLVNGSYVESALMVNRSSDGASWNPPVTITTTGEPDKGWFVCDNGASSPRRGTCYAVWQKQTANDVFQVSATHDGGLTWSTPVATPAQATGYNAQPVIEPNGTLVIVATDTTGHTVLALRSVDGGATLTEPVTVSPITGRDVSMMRAFFKPSAQIGPDGTVYTVWADCRFRASCSANDIVMSTSSNAGQTWSAPARIGPDAASGTVDHFIPALGADPTTPGRLALLYHSFPVAACGAAGQPACQLSAQMVTSTDGGASWSAPVTLTSTPENPNWLPISFKGRMVGDYFGVAWSNGAAVSLVPMTTGNTIGNANGNYNQRMYAAIIGDDTVGVADTTVREPGPGGPDQFAVFPVQLSTPQSSAVTVDYATVDGTATASSGDYTATSGTVTIPAGSTTVGVSVPVHGDGLSEGTETFGLALSAPSGATLSRAQATATVADGDVLPAVSVSDAYVARGSNPNTGPDAGFNVSLNRPSTHPVTVKLATADGSAVAGRDYTAVPATVITFAPGSTSSTFTVATQGAAAGVATTSFKAVLSAPSGAVIGDGTGLGYLVPAAGPTQVRIDNAGKLEGDSGTTNLNFPVVLSGAASTPVSVNYSTAGGTATAGTDFLSVSGSLTIPAGSTSGSIAVPVVGDTIVEPNETFTVTITSTTATVIDAGATGTIIDDDTRVLAGPPPAVAIGDVTAFRGTNPATGPQVDFPLTLTRAATSAVTVRVATANGTAHAGTDFTALAPTTVTFAPGQTAANVTVQTFGGTTESGLPVGFALNVTSPVGAVIEDSAGWATLRPDAGPPQVSVRDAEAAEEAGQLTFKVVLAVPSTGPVSFNYATAGQTATAGSDFTSTSGSLTIPAGSTSATVSVPLINDALVEPTQTLSLTLTAVTGGTFADAFAIGSIVDRD